MLQSGQYGHHFGNHTADYPQKYVILLSKTQSLTHEINIQTNFIFVTF